MRDGNSTIPDGPAGAQGAGITGEPGAVHVIVGTESTRIVLSGEVDADLGAELQEATAEAEQVGLPIEVDAHHVTFMDSSGVAFLARLSIRSQHRVRMIRVPPHVKFLLDVTRIGELLDVVETDDGAEFQPVKE
ncbi:STAS domain-containing protein [Cellulomonas sp. URHD0024]|uniref:STAS domain-containing protein n=1 Tax=Cellulomonas sp. URHD0024 TaxID=1302620 RepID=UPI0003FB307A|nr:STAS domain-containing protein [Cellulomonas sp. URHD0024]